MGEPTRSGEDQVTAWRMAQEGHSSTYFAAPLGSLRSGRLQFVSGASNVTIHADPSMEDLYRARLEGQVRTVGVQGGTVSIGCPRLSSLNQPYYLLDRPAEVALNSSITWHIEVRGGASSLTADLREVRLCLLNLAGGASRTEIRLPRPSGTVSIRILGGASNVTIHRPEGIAVRIYSAGGATNLSLEEKHFGAIGSSINSQSLGYDDALMRN